MTLINAKCSSCGANIKIDDMKQSGICQYCGTMYVKPNAEKTPPDAFARADLQNNQKPKYIPPRPKINCFICAVTLIFWPICLIYIFYTIQQQKDWDMKYGKYF